MTLLVAVAFESEPDRAEWLDRLRPLLPEMTVVGADEVDASEVDVVVVGNPSGSSLTAYSGARLIQSTWAGVDRLIVGAPSVPIARMVAPELAAAMTGFVTMCVQMLHREVPRYQREQREGMWAQRFPPLPAEVTVGVLGFGALGRPAAVALSKLGFDVSAWAGSERAAEVPVLSGSRGWRQILGRSDVIVNLLPLTPETAGILDAAAFSAMRRGAALVNVARGGHVVEDDLIKALDAGHLAEALLDVFVDEPLPAGHPFWSHPRVMVFPHVAAMSDPVILAHHVADNITRLARGLTPRHLL